MGSARSLVLFASILLAPGFAHALEITLLESRTQGYVRAAGDAGVVEEYVYPTALPYGPAQSVSSGASTSTTTYELSNEKLTFGFNHARGVVDRAWKTAEAVAEVTFTVDEEVGYWTRAVYGGAASKGTLYLRLSLYDRTLGQSLVYEVRDFVDLVDPLATIGLNNELQGLLLPGHYYSFKVIALIQNEGSFYFDDYGNLIEVPVVGDTGATATGFAGLRFMPIPEPGSALLLAVGLAGLAVPRAGRRPR